MYLEYKRKQAEALAENNPLKYAMLTAGLGRIINDKLNSYEYNFSHLTKSELIKLNEMCNLDKDTYIMGHELYKIIDNSYTKIGEIDPFEVFENIQKIVHLR